MARELRERVGAVASPAPTASEREMFVSLLSYHYGKGTIDAEDFSERMDEVFAAKSLAELYRLTADLPFPPPLLGPGGQGPSRRRRWWSK